VDFRVIKCAVNAASILSVQKFLSIIGAFIVIGCAFPDYQFAGNGGGGDGGNGAGKGGTNGGGGGASGGNGGSTDAPEDCLNSKDDDADGDVDCDDSDCTLAGYTCVPEVPKDWKGPVAFWSGTTKDTVPTCSSQVGYEQVEITRLLANFVPGESTCKSCSCEGPPTGETRTTNVWWESSAHYPSKCAFLSAEFCSKPIVENPPCNAVTLNKSDLNGVVLAGEAGFPYVRLFVKNLGSNITGGECKPIVTGTETIGEPYSRVGRLCSPKTSGGYCSSNAKICVKQPSTTFSNEVCVYQAADTSVCPLEFSLRKTTQYSSFTDTRKCADCQCPANWGVSPNAKAIISDYGHDSTCTSKPLAFSSKAGDNIGTLNYFENVSTETRYLSAKIEDYNSPTCTPVQPTLTGESVGVNPITVCCTGN
jgi:hypothetical protein